MCHTNFTQKSYWLFILIAIVSLQTACKKNESQPSPVITGLRAISPAPNDSTLTQVVPGQLVVVQGRNFNNARQIFFDGYPAAINPTLNTNNTMVITVPSEIVFASIDPDMANTIKLVTTHGETVFKFSVVPPPPVVNSISNEFAHAGEKITLTGSYLYAINKVVFPGGIEVTNGFTSDASGKSLQVTVPDGITPGNADSIAIVTAGGTGKAAFNNTFGMIANFEDGDPNFGWQWWGGIKSNDASAFPGGWGNYIEIKPGSSINGGDNSWWANNRAVMIASSAWEGVDISEAPGNYALEFQMYVKEPWKNGSLTIVIAGDFGYMVDYAPWKQTGTGQFVSDGWITVAIPLSDFKDGDGKSTTSVSVLTKGEPGNTVQMMLYNNGETPIASFDAAFDNVRVVKVE